MSHSAAATLEPAPTAAPRGLYLVVPKDPPFRPILQGVQRPPKLPAVQREEPEEDSVPPNATDREILVRTANQVGSLYHRFPVVEGEVKEVKDRVRGLGREVRDLHGVVENVRERVEVLETNPPGATQTDTLYPRASPSGHHITVEASDYVAAKEETIGAVRERDSLRVKLEAETMARRLAEAAADGAEKLARNQREKIKLWVAILGAIALVGGSIWTLAVLTHPPTPPTQVAPR